MGSADRRATADNWLRQNLLGRVVVMQQAVADHAGGLGVPGILDDTQAVIANSHPSQLLDSADGPLDHPADFPKPDAV